MFYTITNMRNGESFVGDNLRELIDRATHSFRFRNMNNRHYCFIPYTIQHGDKVLGYIRCENIAGMRTIEFKGKGRVKIYV